MKTILYIIAILVIAAGGWLSYTTMAKFTALKADRTELRERNERLKANVAEAKNNAKEKERVRDIAKTKLTDIESDFETKQSNARLAKRQAAEWQSKIDGQKEKIESTEKLITSIKASFQELGEDVELDEIPDLVKKLEDDRNESTKKLEELESHLGVIETRENQDADQLEALNGRIAKRAERIKANAAEGRITSVNHDYGFAIVNIPNNMLVDETTSLLVKRGSSFIGKLKVNSIEGTSIVTDIDFKSIKPGMVIRSGDTVVLAKPVTN